MIVHLGLTMAAGSSTICAPPRLRMHFTALGPGGTVHRAPGLKTTAGAEGGPGRLAFAPTGTSDHALSLKTGTADVAAAGRVPYDKPTPQNSVMLLIDHQIGLMVGVRDFASLATYKANVSALAKMAKALGILTMLSSSNA